MDKTRLPPQLDEDFSLDQDQPSLIKQIEQLIETHRLPIALGLGGVLLIGLGLLISQSRGEVNQIEIIPAQSSTDSVVFELAIDIAGAIQNPGLYQLSPDSRVEDLLIAAGGLSSDAHRDWVAQHLNRARKLVDGEKIYIPFEGETNLPAGSVSGTSSTSPISINTASQAQLESLWGIGPVTAQNIIDNRPYSSFNDLLDRKVIKNNVWEQNKDKLSL
jgi:competence protein ComEA